ncbi:MAG: hypothetical protein AAB428_03770 [Patescibacteria group bacterium]
MKLSDFSETESLLGLLDLRRTLANFRNQVIETIAPPSKMSELSSARKVEEIVRMERIMRNVVVARSLVPASRMSDEEKNDTRPCKHCGGWRRLHGIYGTLSHVPDLDKPLDGYPIATAFCDKFESAS